MRLFFCLGARAVSNGDRIRLVHGEARGQKGEGVTHIAPALLLEFPEVFDMACAQVVECHGYKAPWLSVQFCRKLV